MDDRMGEDKLPVVNKAAHVIVMSMRQENVGHLIGLT